MKTYAMGLMLALSMGVGVGASVTTRALAEALQDSPLRRRQVEAFARIDAIMSTGDQSPSARAADIVLATMRKARRPN